MDPEELRDALERFDADPDGTDGTARADRKALTRHLLALLEQRAPGRSVEVRIPPFGAVQVIPGGTHTRGTPRAVVETDPVTWIRVATGREAWSDALAEGRILASGERTDLSALLPLL